MLKSTAPVKIPVFALNKSSPSWEQAECEGEQLSASVVRSRLRVWLCDKQKDVFGCVWRSLWRSNGQHSSGWEHMVFSSELSYCWLAEKSLPSALGPGVPVVAWQGASLSRGAAGISASLGAENQGYPTRTGTVGNPCSCADCVKCTPFPRAYRHSYKRSKDGRNDIPLLIIVWSHLYIWCYVTNSSLLFSSREILLQVEAQHKRLQTSSNVIATCLTGAKQPPLYF